MDRYGTVCLVAVNKIADKALYISIENQSDKLTVSIDNRRSGVAADDIARADKIQWSREVELLFPFKIAQGD